MSYSESFFEQNLIETIRAQTDIVAIISSYLSLKKSGQNFVGLCPFHTEKSPSFSVNPAKQFFHCFGCSVGGDVFAFISKIEQISFPEAVRLLAEKAGIPIVSERSDARETSKADQEAELIYKINEEAATLFHHNLMERPEAEQARKALKDRGISAETIEAFLIGFALPRGGLSKQLKCSPALLEKACLVRNGENGPYDYFWNRIIFPIKTLQGKIAAFGGRVLDDALPKYLNSSETPVFTKGKHLFGLDRARGKQSLIVVEGYFDAISLHQKGITNVVATLGTAMTEDHLRLIRFVETVTLLFDPDRAGIAAALRVAPLFIENKKEAKVVSLPEGCDPDLFIRKQGKAVFLEKLKTGEPILSFVIRQAALSSSASSYSIAEKTKAIAPIFSLIRKIQGQTEQGYYLKIISDCFGIEEKDIRIDFAREKGIGVSVVPLPLKKSHLPEDEKTLLALLIQDQLEVALLEPVVPDDFTTPDVKNIVHYFWNAERNVWINKPGFPAMNVLDSNQSLYSALAVFEVSNENRETLVSDCILSLQKKKLLRDTIKIQTQLKLAERGGDSVQVASLQSIFFNLKKELSQIGSSH